MLTWCGLLLGPTVPSTSPPILLKKLLQATDAVEVYLRGGISGNDEDGSPAAALEALLAVLADQAAYVREALGMPILPASQLGSAADVIAAEEHSVPVGEEGQRAEFEVVLVRPAGGAAGGSRGGADGVAVQLRQTL